MVQFLSCVKIPLHFSLYLKYTEISCRQHYYYNQANDGLYSVNFHLYKHRKTISVQGCPRPHPVKTSS